MRALFCAVVALLAACSPPPDHPGCLDEEPAVLGRTCAGDGECGNWLVCIDATCELPPAVAGEGGAIARITDDDRDTIVLAVEVARSDLARTRGLGHRPCIEPGWGLVIDYPDPGEHLITTASMRFALDIAMIGADGVIHTIHRDAPPGSEALYGASQPVAKVLEVAAGAIQLRENARVEVHTPN